MKRTSMRLMVTLVAAFIFATTTLYMVRAWCMRLYFHQESGHRTQGKPMSKQEPVKDKAILPAANVTHYLDAILAKPSSTLPTLECPAMNATRYAALKSKDTDNSATIQYYFALNLRQNLPLLPSLIGSIIQAIQFLGPKQCALSIVEGHSPDGTADVLNALRPILESIGIAYYFKSSEVDPSQDNRVARLARLRNEALAPLQSFVKATYETTIVFLNDVSICAEDVLELVHQKKALGADMTCAMDWTFVGQDPTFYDVWIARTIDGDSFFEIPSDGNWNSAWNLFWNADESRNRFSSRRPFQVFSCWNGATAFAAQPIIDKVVYFRAADETAGECRQGEPQTFCKDLWFNGYRKIAVVPSVNLEYSVEKARRIKEAKGYTSDIVSSQDAADDTIQWRLDPPEKVKCMPGWENQYWQSWNETLGQ